MTTNGNLRRGVQVIHGANDGVFDLIGLRIESAQTSLATIFNVPELSVAIVNGIRVDWSERLRDGDVLEFVFPWGRKGAGDDDYDYFANLTDSKKLNELYLQVRDLKNEIAEMRKEKAPAKDFYSVQDFAKLIDLEPDTVREHCRHGRLKAAKGVIGRGGIQEWRISHAELIRYKNHGLLPFRKN